MIESNISNGTRYISLVVMEPTVLTGLKQKRDLKGIEP